VTEARSCTGRSPPGLHGSLLLERPDLLGVHGQGSCVDDFGLPVAVGELQSAIPLPVGLTDDGVGWVVLHFCRDPAGMDKSEEESPGRGPADLDRLRGWGGGMAFAVWVNSSEQREVGKLVRAA
jgi:hypothetical protein